MSAASNSSTSCNPIQGNSDFYGQGIRIGIYLQWLSAWISVLVEPTSAQPILELNSVFVFAIVIATIAAYDSVDIQPIETYIMLQFSFGFFLTTMSIFGLRLQLMGLESAAHILQECKQVPHRVKESMTIHGGVPSLEEFVGQHPELPIRSRILLWVTNYISWVSAFSVAYTQVNLNAFKFLKPQHLAWSGVLWRAEIAGVVAGFNLAFWFNTLSDGATLNDCVPVVFMFSSQLLSGGLVTLFQVGAVIAAVIIFLQAVFLAILSIRLLLFLLMCIYRDLIFRNRPEARERIRASVERLNSVLNAGLSIGTFLDPLMTPTRIFTTLNVENNMIFRLISPFRSWTDYLKFFLASDVDGIHFTDIFKLCASLASHHVTVETIHPNNQSSGVAERHSPGSYKKHSWVSISWNILTISTIVWFVLSIELTIAWNGIYGVNTVQSTGQLIPLIIGIASSASTLQTVVVAVIKKAYPDWTKVKLDVKIDSGGYMEFQIVKQQHIAVQGAGEAGDDQA